VRRIESCTQLRGEEEATKAAPKTRSTKASHGTERPSATVQEGISHMTALEQNRPSLRKKSSQYCAKQAPPPSSDISVRVNASLIGYAGECPRAGLPSNSGSRGRHVRCLLPFFDSPPSARSSFTVASSWIPKDERNVRII
jgi:hypothetical protein